jgi:hypothetical protein
VQHKETGSKPDQKSRQTITADHKNLQPGTILLRDWDLHPYRLKVLEAQSWPWYKCWLYNIEAEQNYHAAYLVSDYKLEGAL